MIRYVPFPQMRIVFRATLYLSLGLCAFGLELATGFKPLWWVGLLLCYMAAQRLIMNVVDQFADRAHARFVAATRAPALVKLEEVTKTQPPQPEPRFIVAAPMKTGSQSVYASLQAAFGSKFIYHTHYLASDISDKGGFHYRSYTKQQAAMRALLEPTQPQYIISLIRDPGARLYSNLFHYEAQRINAAHRSRDIASIQSFLREKAQDLIALNVDYYKNQFRPIGIKPIRQTSSASNRTFRLFRMEDFRETFSAEIKRLTGQDVPLIHKNDAAHYGNPEAYEWFKQFFRLPERVVRDLYDDKVVRAFYTDAEIEHFKETWLSDPPKLLNTVQTETSEHQDESAATSRFAIVSG